MTEYRGDCSGEDGTIDSGETDLDRDGRQPDIGENGGEEGGRGEENMTS